VPIRVYFDTNIWISAMDSEDPKNDAAKNQFEHVRLGKHTLVISKWVFLEIMKFLIDKVADSNGHVSDSQIISGIQWGISNGARIISMSLGRVANGSTQANCDADSSAMTTAVNNAVNYYGITVVAAAGNNDAPGIIDSPACISNTIAVGAVDGNDNLAWYSNTGPAMADHGVVAPGCGPGCNVGNPATWLFSAWPAGLNNCNHQVSNGGYDWCTGTSMATPVVSGTVALLLGRFPSLTPANVKQILYATSNCVGGGGCPNNNFGHGRVNALNAINALNPINNGFTMSVNPASTSFYCSNTLCDPQQRVTLTVSLAGGVPGVATLTYTGPGGSWNPAVSGPSSVFVPPPGSTNSVALLAGPVTCCPGGTWVWTIAGGTPQTTETMSVITCPRLPCPTIVVNSGTISQELAPDRKVI